MKAVRINLVGYGFFKEQTQQGFMTSISGMTATVRLLAEQTEDGKKIWITREYSLLTGKDVRAAEGFRAFAGFAIDWATFPPGIRDKAEKRAVKAERRAKRKAQKRSQGLSVKHTVQVKDEVDTIGTVTVILKEGGQFTFANAKVARRELRRKGLSVTHFTKLVEGDQTIWKQ